MLPRVLPLLLSFALLAACKPASSAGGSSGGGLAELAHAARVAGCEHPIVSPPVPAAAASAPGTDDVVVYTAHPDDEAMYGGGTIAALAKAGRRVSVVVMSHGEGGRLLELGADGKVIERRDVPPDDVAALRDREIADAVARVGALVAQVYPASARVDYGWTTSCAEAIAHWDGALPGGVGGMLERLILDMRKRRPRVVITLDPRDDPQASHHGHHKGVGMLVELAARAAADASIPGGEPHPIDELLSFAPANVAADVELDVGADARVAMLSAYPSQFRELDALAKRSVERFTVRWRARGAQVPAAGSVVGTLITNAR